MTLVTELAIRTFAEGSDSHFRHLIDLASQGLGWFSDALELSHYAE
jgi:hypothetical protein